jgi:hypothetical protein
VLTTSNGKLFSVELLDKLYSEMANAKFDPKAAVLHAYSPSRPKPKREAIVPNCTAPTGEKMQRIVGATSQSSGPFMTIINSAWYGDPGNRSRGKDVTTKVRSMVDSRGNLRVQANNENFGDPAPGTGKILEVKITNLEGESKIQTVGEHTNQAVVLSNVSKEVRGARLATAVAPQPATFQVQLPQDAQPGQALQIPVPAPLPGAGELVSFVVPPGCSGGQIVSLPAPQSK